MRVWIFMLGVGLCLRAGPALAHIALGYPTPRTDQQKLGPCGARTVPRSVTPTILEPGQTILVTWTETIEHPGHFRISFDDDGEDGLVDPTGYDSLNVAPSVLVDGIADRVGTGTQYSQMVTLPNVACERCTLQLIQVMTDKPPWGDGNDIYYQCADLVLRRRAAPDSGAPPDAAIRSDGAIVRDAARPPDATSNRRDAGVRDGSNAAIGPDPGLGCAQSSHPGAAGGGWLVGVLAFLVRRRTRP